MSTTERPSTPDDALSFQAVIEATRRLDELSCARVVGLVAEAVHAAQRGGQPLGTITPSAIAVLADGGVQLAPGAGSARYAAPEKLRGRSLDRRADVFALGALLWEALAHEPLFDGATDDAIKQAVLAGAVRPPSELNANVPAELDAICQRALAAEPANRYQSAKVMAAEIDAVLSDAGYPEDNDAIAAYVTRQLAARPAPASRASLTSTDAGLTLTSNAAPAVKTSPFPTVLIAPAPVARTLVDLPPPVARTQVDLPPPVARTQVDLPPPVARTASDTQPPRRPQVDVQPEPTQVAAQPPSTARDAPAPRRAGTTEPPGTGFLAAAPGTIVGQPPAVVTPARPTGDTQPPNVRAAEPAQPPAAWSSPTGTSPSPFVANRPPAPTMTLGSNVESEPIVLPAKSLPAIPDPRTEAAPGKLPSVTARPLPSITDARPSSPSTAASSPSTPASSPSTAASSPSTPASSPSTAASSPSTAASSPSTAASSPSTPASSKGPLAATAFLGSNAVSATMIDAATRVGTPPPGAATPPGPTPLQAALEAPPSPLPRLAPGEVASFGPPAMPAPPSGIAVPAAAPSNGDGKRALPAPFKAPGGTKSIATAETVGTPHLASAPGPQSTIPGFAAVPAHAAPPDTQLSMPPGMTAAPAAPGVPLRSADHEFEDERHADPAQVVALPHEGRDVIGGWGWKTGNNEVVEEDDHDFEARARASRKRLIITFGAALGVAAVIAILAVAFGGSKKPADDRVATRAPTSATAAPAATGSAAPIAASGSSDPAGAAARSNDPAASTSTPVEGSAAAPTAPTPTASAPTPTAPTATAPTPTATAPTPTATAPTPTAPTPTATAPSATAPTPNATATAPTPNATATAPTATGRATAPTPTATTPTPTPAATAPTGAGAAVPPAPAKLAAEPPKPAKPEAGQPKPAPVRVAAEPRKPAEAKKPGEPKKPVEHVARPAPRAQPVDPYETAADKPKADPAAAYRTGLQQYARGDTSGALATFRGSASSNPGFAPTWRGLGLVYEKMGNKAQARSAFRRYLQLAPTASDADQVRDRLERLGS